jgi:hypothetical protein
MHDQTLSVSILIAAGVIACAIFFTGRYEIVAAGENSLVFRLDRVTGSVTACLPLFQQDQHGPVDCKDQ